MTSTIQYPDSTLKRAARAIACSSFELSLFTILRQQSVALQAIAGNSGVEHQYTRRSLSELRAENDLLWLIQVGVLRREVDGQGLTDSFRLTPLGRQLLDQWQPQGHLPTPSLLDHLYNGLNRWLRSPF